MPGKMQLKAIKTFSASSALAVWLDPRISNAAHVLHPVASAPASHRGFILIALGIITIVLMPIWLVAIFLPTHFKTKSGKNDAPSHQANSNIVEAIIWLVPIVIMVTLAGFVWTYTHHLGF